MKTRSPRSKLLQPLYTFEAPTRGYSILLVPNSGRAKAELVHKAKTKGMSLRDFAQDEILAVMCTPFP